MQLLIIFRRLHELPGSGLKDRPKGRVNSETARERPWNVVKGHAQKIKKLRMGIISGILKEYIQNTLLDQ